jgi:hypothetical protein
LGASVGTGNAISAGCFSSAKEVSSVEVTRLYIEGQNLDRLVDLLRGRLPDCYAYTSENIVVLASEKFYFRVESNLLTVVILNVSVEDRYEVEIVTGGGAQGLFGITWGAERHRSAEIVRFLEETCTSNSWMLARQSLSDS